MITKHCDNLMKRMSNDGQWYAQEVCYREKAITPEQGFIAGYLNACEMIQSYAKQYGLDKLENVWYTKRKAHKK